MRRDKNRSAKGSNGFLSRSPSGSTQRKISGCHFRGRRGTAQKIPSGAGEKSQGSNFVPFCNRRKGGTVRTGGVLRVVAKDRDEGFSGQYIPVNPHQLDEGEDTCRALKSPLR